MIKNKGAFSFVELLVTISIIIILFVVGINYNSNRQENTFNSKIESDVITMKNAFIAYESANKKLPTPGGNVNYYKSDTSYSHSWDSEDTYGVHGFVTEKTLPKQYQDFVPLDPKTNQFYAYGKTKKVNQFEIASVIYVNGNPEAKVEGNYVGETGPINLIREYNGPHFISNLSHEYFPYNPEERLLTASIGVFSGSVSVNGDSSDIQDKVLVTGDTITVGAGSNAEIYFSDGSKSILGDSSSESSLELTEMSYIKENNLITKIVLALNVGSIWTKATDLDEESDFEVFTIDATAAVRGTIFGVSKDSGGDTDITVVNGTVEYAKNDIPANYGTSTKLSDLYKKNNISHSETLSGSITVEEWEEPKGEKINENEAIPSTDITDFEHIDNLEYTPIDNVLLDIKEIEDTDNGKILRLEDGNGFKGVYGLFTKNKNNTADNLLANCNNNFCLINNTEYKGNVFACTEKKIKNKKGHKTSFNLGLINSADALSLTLTFDTIETLKKYEINPTNVDVSDLTNLLDELNTKKISESTSKENKKIINKQIKTLKKAIKAIKSKNDLINNTFNYNTNITLECTKKPKFIDFTKSIEENDLLTQEEIDKNNYENAVTELTGDVTDTDDANCIKGLCNTLKNGWKLVAAAPYDEDLKLYYDENTYSGAITQSLNYNNESQKCDGDGDCDCDYEGGSYDNNDNGLCNDDGIYGIVIDNTSPDLGQDYLQYKDLKLNGNVAIEISVKGSSLLRDDLTYYLFKLGNIYLDLYEGKLFLGYDDYINVRKINKDNINMNIDKDNYYKIISYFNGNDWDMKIYGDDGVNTESTKIKGHTGFEIENNNDLYIGNNVNGASYNNQWNDIIDYVKIYKK